MQPRTAVAGWLSTNQKSKPGAFERMEKDMGCVLSANKTLTLMQNCDLPPPVKLFAGPEGIFASSMSKIYRGVEEGEVEEQIRMYKDCSRDDKLEILKALQLSQTRAREAERKLRVLSEEKERLSNLIVDESMKGFAYRQLVNLMEFEVLKLQKHWCVCNCGERCEDCDEGNNSCMKWCTAIAFCLAIAGMSFAFGCRYLF